MCSHCFLLQNAVAATWVMWTTVPAGWGRVRVQEAVLIVVSPWMRTHAPVSSQGARKRRDASAGRRSAQDHPWSRPASKVCITYNTTTYFTSIFLSNFISHLPASYHSFIILLPLILFITFINSVKTCYKLLDIVSVCQNNFQ